MSVICQNFVQNAWKKDLCSNCFKSFSDHTSAEDPCSVLLTRTEVEENEKNTVFNNLNGTRYISQATTIYESWKTLINDQTSTAFVLLKSPQRQEIPPEIVRQTPTVISETQTQPTSNGVAQGILKVGSKPSEVPRRNSVGFKEDHVQVIGYGGNDDYDSDEGNWEMSSDDDVSLESLDCTEEEKVITKITKENTDFNSNNENLLTPQEKPPKVAAENNSEGDKNSVGPELESAAVPSSVCEDSLETSTSSDPSTPVTEDVITTDKDETGEMQRQQEDTPKEGEEVQGDDPKVIAATLCKNSVPVPGIYEARSSFLHSIAEPPVAIYTPASDLFVHRGSTSSSSSEEDATAKVLAKPPAAKLPLKPKIPAKPVVKKEQNVPPVSPASTDDVSPREDIAEVKPVVSPAPPEEVVGQASPQVNETTETVHVANSASVPPEPENPVVQKENGRNFYDGSIYYAVSEPFSTSPEHEARNMNLARTLHYSETNIYQEVKNNNNRSPEKKDIKLAALAVELEQARYSSTPSKRAAPAPPANPPEQQLTPAAKTESPYYYYASRKLGFLKSKSEKDNDRLNGSTSPTAVYKSPSPTESSDDSTPKNKKSIFSFKKLLKRGNSSKDLVSDDVAQMKSTNNPTNRKAWKHAEFDKSRLRLEIVHPMDMPKVDDGAPPESVSANGSGSPVRHLEDGMYEGVTVERYGAIVIPADCRNVHQLPECQLQKCPPGRPDDRESVMATPDSPSSSCSGSSSGGPSRPAKPPPPPRCKAHTPTRSVPASAGSNGPQPRKPVVPKRHLRHNAKTDYANLGQVRTPMAPKKPQRSSSMASNSGENSGEEQGRSGQQGNSRTYEALNCQVDSSDSTVSGGSETQEEELYSNTAVPTQASSPPSKHISRNGPDPMTTRTCTQGDRPPSSPPGSPTCPDQASHRADWPTFEASYARITMSNHEALTKLLEHISTSSHLFPCESKIGGQMEWDKFELEGTSNIEGLQISSATYKETSCKVTLLVTKKTSFLPPVPQLLKHRTIVSFLDNDTIVLVLPRGAVSPVHHSNLHSSPHAVAYVLLQVISTLKALQSTGMEEVEACSQKCWLVEWETMHPQLVYLHQGIFPQQESDSEKVTLCQYVQKIILQLLHYQAESDIILDSTSDNAIFSILSSVLAEEKASSLSQAKRLLEYFLWAPWDLLKANWPVQLEAHLQRWLDIQRAEVWKRFARGLHSDGMPCSVYLEHKLSFLVNGSGKMLKDVSLFLNENGFFRVDSDGLDSEELYQDGMLTPL
ncbi:treacle protein-like isoform X2 [Ornithodoros turicata]|uniref:treacle protein-like isoform X2 n=1 Tax=Ornithodoros turicata TaxID=34597 RepID=UPI003138DE2D